MITVNQNFQQIYQPKKALLVYQSIADQKAVYVESYDISPSGCPINAHPLSEAESIGLARSLAESRELSSNYLQPKGIIPDNLLYTSIGLDGYAIWYTKPKAIALKFVKELGVPSGTAPVPALIWKANKKELSVYAVKLREAKPTMEIPLYHAPLFNIYEKGNVCMGTVKVDITDSVFLEDFIAEWERYFFNSYFSHTMQGHLPTKTNIVQLWTKLIEDGNSENSQGRFPDRVLKPTGKQFKDLLQ